jgi:hypothetical protein
MSSQLNNSSNSITYQDEEETIDPTLIEEENPKHSQDEISEIAGVDLNFDTATFSSMVTDDEEEKVFEAVKLAVVEVKREASQEAAKGEEEIEEEAKIADEEAAIAVVVQKKVAQEVAEEIAEEGRQRRKSIPSNKVAENIQLAAEAEAAKRQAAAKAVADQQAKKEEAERAARIVNQPLSQVSVFTGPEGSIAKKMIIKNIRLESYDPTSQARIIFGDKEFFNNTKRDSLCYLCGFKFEDRISFHHNKTKNYVPPRITLSFDHFVPINFSAVVFRIPVAKGKSKYTRDELELLKVIGGMACYHCNYEKSQRMFITCKKEGGDVDFNKFQPNDGEIKSFLNDLYKSENKHGWGRNPGERTLNLCLLKNGLTKKQWIDRRFEAIQTLANNVCNLIKQKVDRSKVETRIKLTKVLVQKAKEDLEQDDIFNKLKSQEGRYRYSRVYIAGLFGAAELTFPTPWNTGSMSQNPLAYQPVIKPQSVGKSVGKAFGKPVGKPEPLPSGKPKGIRIYNPLEKQKLLLGQKITKKGGSRRRRKTYRRIRLF